MLAWLQSSVLAAAVIGKGIGKVTENHFEKAKTVMLVFDSQFIKDTVVKYPDPDKWVNGFKAKRLVFGVQNDLNQNVSVQPIGRAGAAQGNLGTPTTIDANSEGLITLDLRAYWSPFISISLTAVSSPSSGKISVYAVWDE